MGQGKSGVVQNIWQRALVARLAIQSCELDPAGCTAASLAFIFRGEFTFFVPRPGDDGFTLNQLKFIEHTFSALELELYPLDLWASA